MDINDKLFEQIVETAKLKAGGEARWVAAIDRAVKMLDGNPYIHLDGDELLVMSDTSLKTYAANGSCQCEAFAFGRICKHRIAARLLTRYFEALAARESEQDVDGATETAITLDAPTPPFVFERETLASHSSWCPGCIGCWSESEAA
jgi:hypothetical protein